MTQVRLCSGTKRGGSADGMFCRVCLEIAGAALVGEGRGAAGAALVGVGLALGTAGVCDVEYWERYPMPPDDSKAYGDVAV